MDVRPVDPRDIQTEEDTPAYRVYFWERLPARAHVPPDLAGHTSTEFELTGAGSVIEALAWAEANTGPNRTFVLYVRTHDHRLVRVAGTDPAHSRPHAEGG